jgi:hypothetical protein
MVPTLVMEGCYRAWPAPFADLGASMPEAPPAVVDRIVDDVVAAMSTPLACLRGRLGIGDAEAEHDGTDADASIVDSVTVPTELWMTRA